MTHLPSPSLEAWLREARRLRFAEAGIEARFQDERVTGGLNRARVMLGAALTVVVMNGCADYVNLAGKAPEFLTADLQLRFLAAVPACVLMLASTWVPGHVRRAEWVNALGVAVLAAMPVLIFWHYAVHFPTRQFVGQLIGNVLPILVLAAFALPLRFRTIATVTVLVLAGAVGFLWWTVLAERRAEFRVLWTSLLGTGGATLLLAWWREAGERAMFAQREHARALASELERSNAELARLNAEKNEFMAVAAHDLRAPLGIVRGLLELLRTGKIDAAEKRAEAIVRAQDETVRMLALVDDYLGAHAAESGALPVRLARIDLGVAATAAAARHAETARAKAQTLQVEAPAGRVWVSADEALLAQVSDNFVSNAIKFSPHGAPVRIELLVGEGGGPARLAVIDAGPGIAAEEQGKLFRKFGRLGHKPTGGEPSTGLGLAVAKRLAEAMGGTVGCDSEAGGGATFWIQLAQAN